MKAVAVTGASGALGRLVVARLLDDPAVERVIAIDRRAGEVSHPRLTPVTGDIRDPDLERQLVGCDALAHLAFVVERGRDDAETEAINVGGTRAIVGAAARAGVGHLVFASSIAAYGFHPDQVGRVLDETAPLRGNDDFYYARHKAACERWLDEFAAAHPAIAVARLRPSVFLGPRGGRRLAPLRWPLVPYLAGHSAAMHVTHEDDVVEAFHRALARRAAGAYNIATDEPLPGSALAGALGRRGLPVPERAAALLGRDRLDPAWLRAGRQPIVVTSAKARRDLGWRPRWPTTGAVVRELAGRPTAVASLGTRALLGTLAEVTRWRGELPMPGRARDELDRMHGSINWILTGDHPSEWRITVGQGLGIHRGLAGDALATTTMAERTLFELLAGELTWPRAQMTGRVRMTGDGNYGLLVGGVVAGLQQLFAAKRGPQARVARWILRAGPDRTEKKA